MVTNPHGFPPLVDLITATGRQRLHAATARWMGTFATSEHGTEFLAQWREAIAENEEREGQRARAESAKRKGEALEAMLTTAIPAAFVANGAAPRDVRLWQAGEHEVTAALASSRETLVMPDRPFLLLLGNVGVGKTCGVTLALLEHAAAQARKGEWNPNATPVFWNAAEVAVGALLGRAGEEKLEQAKMAPVLVLDDLGAEPMLNADVWLAVFGVVIDVRYRREMPTLITTNLDEAALKQRYGARFSDRVRQCGRVRRCEKASMRKSTP